MSTIPDANAQTALVTSSGIDFVDNSAGTNDTLHHDFNVPYVRDEIKKLSRR